MWKQRQESVQRLTCAVGDGFVRSGMIAVGQWVRVNDKDLRLWLTSPKCPRFPLLLSLHIWFFARVSLFVCLFYSQWLRTNPWILSTLVSQFLLKLSYSLQTSAFNWSISYPFSFFVIREWCFQVLTCDWKKPDSHKHTLYRWWLIATLAIQIHATPKSNWCRSVCLCDCVCIHINLYVH